MDLTFKAEFEIIPDFELSDATGNTVNFKDLLAEGPVVLTFYRGGWCPYCNIQLRAYQENLDQFQALGANLVAISPEKPDNSLETAEKNELEFTVLSDVGNEVADKFGLRYEIFKQHRDAPGFRIIATDYAPSVAGGN